MSLPTFQASELEQAFQAFTSMSERLEGSYRTLEQRVVELSAELTEARSERMQQLAEKERLADRLARLHELLPAGVILLDSNGVVSECNPAASELLGEPLLQQRWVDVIRRAFVHELCDGGEYTLRDGRKVNITTRPLGSEPGQIVLLMETTEQHALRKRLDRHQRLTAMGEMVASLAHQVRTPLSSALLYMSSLNRHNLSERERKRFTDKVIGRIRHLEHMVNDMLQFARGESFEMTHFSIADLLDDVHSTLEPLLRIDNGRLRITQPPHGCSLYGNRRALHDVLMNFATNALQACGPLAQLHLEVRRHDNQDTEFLLHDNGPGITPEIADKLFTPFFTTQAEGTGLGLSVARSIVLAHKGDIWARNHDQGTGGCTFGMRIPGQLADSETATRKPALEQPLPSGRDYGRAGRAAYPQQTSSKV